MDTVIRIRTTETAGSDAEGSGLDALRGWLQTWPWSPSG